MRRAVTASRKEKKMLHKKYSLLLTFIANGDDSTAETERN